MILALGIEFESVACAANAAGSRSTASMRISGLVTSPRGDSEKVVPIHDLSVLGRFVFHAQQSGSD